MQRDHAADEGVLGAAAARLLGRLACGVGGREEGGENGGASVAEGRLTRWGAAAARHKPRAPLLLLAPLLLGRLGAGPAAAAQPPSARLHSTTLQYRTAVPPSNSPASRSFSFLLSAASVASRTSFMPAGGGQGRGRTAGGTTQGGQQLWARCAETGRGGAGGRTRAVSR